MSLYVLDTDHVSLHQRRHPLVSERIAQCAADTLAITAVTVGEQMRRRLTKLGQSGSELSLAYAQLVRTVEYFCGLHILPFDDKAQGISSNCVRKRYGLGRLICESLLLFCGIRLCL